MREDGILTLEELQQKVSALLAIEMTKYNLTTMVNHNNYYILESSRRSNNCHDAYPDSIYV